MINIPSTIKISFRALWVNKMRSSLTMLGIIIGVGAVIAMVAIGSGASQKISEQISSMGSNLLIVLPGLPHRAVSGWDREHSPRSRWAMPRLFEGMSASGRRGSVLEAQRRLYSDT